MLQFVVASDLKNLKLNEEQKTAIKHGEGPLLIIAGAGTGKTTVITERIKYLTLSKRAKPSEILALTFTEKAAREMEERVDVSLPYGYTQMWIMTFHAFCDRILRRDALHIGLDPRYKLMTEAESIQLLRKNLFKLDLKYFRPLGNPTKFISGMLQHFSRLQDEDISPQDYQKWVKGQMSTYTKSPEDKKMEINKWDELSRVYKQYDELKVKNSFLDFGDVIVKTLKLFRDRPNILSEYKKQFKYILVDEFQDTNFSQNELVMLLSGRGNLPAARLPAGQGRQGNVTVVADDDQSIYRFRGAAVSNVIQFRKNYPKTKIIVLTKNYRSTQEILDASYQLIQFNNPDRLEVVEKIDKRLIAINRLASQGPGKKLKSEISFIHSDRVEQEADEIAKKVNQLIDESVNQYKYKDIAILVRANTHSEPIGRAMSRHGIPYQFLGPGRLFKQPEIIDLISYLKVLYNFEDSVAFYRILSNDYFDVPGRDIAAMGNYARKYNKSLFETADRLSHEASDRQGGFAVISEKTKDTLNKLLKIIDKHLDLVKKETAGQLLYFYLEETGLLQKLLSPESADAEKKAQNISKFFDKLKTYEVDHEDASVSAVVDWLDLSIELGESPLATDTDWTDINAVNILTVHSAKGLEFPVVFLVNLVAQRFPTIERREQIPIPDGLIKEVLPVGDYHTEEERRLFYVGMTRAKEKLFLTAADFYGEGKREKKLSPFIFEALGDNATAAEQSKIDHQQLSFLDYKPVDKLKNIESQQPIHIDYLSVSQIETFQTCPLHFKLKYIYKLPTPPSASISFGITTHATLKAFYEAVALGTKPSEKMIIELLENNWIKEGYSSKKHESEFLLKGKDYMVGYLKNGFNPKNLPIALEQPFVVPLANPTSREASRVSPLKIGGKIDRVDDLGNGIIEIVDYKTGATIPTQKDVDRNLQLSFYAIAASTLRETPFGKPPDKIKLSLYFLDTQEKISTVRTLEQLNAAKEEIFKARDEIEKSDFKCSGHMFCQMGCEFSLFCKSDS